jgi:hypothetical protein
MKPETLLAFDSRLIAVSGTTFREARLAWWRGELISLLPLIARRLAERIEQLPLRAMHQLRAMLWDYVYLVRPGSEESLLRGAPELELETLSLTLAWQVAEAAEDEANKSVFASTRDLAEVIAEWSREETAEEFLERWMQLSRIVGVTPADFLQTRLRH